MTAQQVKQRFRANGTTVSDWARRNGFPPYKVMRVLNGVEKGHYGQAHDIAVALGLKPQPEPIL